MSRGLRDDGRSKGLMDGVCRSGVSSFFSVRGVVVFVFVFVSYLWVYRLQGRGVLLPFP